MAAAIAPLALVAARSGAVAAESSSWIVFSAQANGAGAAQLFRVETTGSGLAQITTGGKTATQPAFSPNGKQVLFARLGSGIFRVNLDGTGLRRLTSGIRDTHPVWSPNGKRIAFVRPYRAEWRLYTMSPSGTGERRLPQAPPAGRPSWSANGKSIFIPAAASIVKVDARTGNVQKRFSVRLDPAISQAATVSPNSRSFAFVARRAPTGPPDCGESHCPAYALYVAAASTGRPRRIANDTGPAGWSPDGRTVVFVARGALTLAVVATGKTTGIATGADVATGDAPPAWQPR